MATLTPQDEAARHNTKSENEAFNKNAAPQKGGKIMGKVNKAVHAVQGVVEKAETMVGLKTKTTETKDTEGSNFGVVFNGTRDVSFGPVPYPKMELPWNNQPVTNGAILKVLTSGICGSDLHPYRGRTPMKPGVVLGHEFTGEIVEIGSDVQHMKVGDWGAVPFNVACGTCPNCKEGKPNVCSRNNHEFDQYGQCGIYGYVCGGDWQGGQAQFAFIPFADYNFIRFEDKTLAKTKLLDLTLLTDVLPTAMHGTEEAEVHMGQTVYIAGAGPIGLTAAAICLLKGAAHVIVSDFIPERLELARRQGCLTIDLSHVEDEKKLSTQIKDLIGSQWVDCSIECVGYEARGFGSKKDQNVCAGAFQGCIEVTKPGGRIGVLGAFFAGDPKAPTPQEKKGLYTVPLGNAWMKALIIQGGQAQCMRYESMLHRMILANKLPIASLLSAKVVPLEDAAKAYEEFDGGSAHKYIFDPHNTLGLCSSTGTKSTIKQGGRTGKRSGDDDQSLAI